MGKFDSHTSVALEISNRSHHSFPIPKKVSCPYPTAICTTKGCPAMTDVIIVGKKYSFEGN